MEKPRLRIIHNMARSGSTLICKCLGCMEGVVLLSELHPYALKHFDPLKQAEQWFGLVNQNDIAELKNKGGVTYAQAIALVERRCADRGDTLVLRDWAHLDYTGFPFVSQPAYRPLLYAELMEDFDIVRISITRDPVTQWQSISSLTIMQSAIRTGMLGIEKFLSGYKKYAELCMQTGFIRYEDFLVSPESEMQKLCGLLAIKFDPGFVEKWHTYMTITGDLNPNNPSKITVPKPQPVEPDLKRMFLSNQDYYRACEMLGYDPLN